MKATLTLLALGCAAMTSPLSAGVRSISSISLERECGACPQGGVITLNRDESLRWLRRGHARLGTQDETLEGRMARGSFGALTALFIEKNYFSLREHYADPDLADGPWSLLIVEFDDHTTKRVFRRDEAGPAVLRELESAIDSAVSSTQLSAAPR